MGWQLFAAILLAAMNASAQECGMALGSELVQRVATDQAARKALITTPGSKELHAAALRAGTDNTVFMRRVLEKCSWPRKSMVGVEAAKAAWLLTQHADMDPDYQILAARQMKSAVYAKEADPLLFAYLVDRNRRLNDQPQVYGMQHYADTAGTIVFYDIVNPTDLDSRRKDIGLVPFYCMVSRISKEKKGAPARWPTGIPFQPTDCTGDPETRQNP